MIDVNTGDNVRYKKIGEFVVEDRGRYVVALCGNGHRVMVPYRVDGLGEGNLVYATRNCPDCKKVDEQAVELRDKVRAFRERYKRGRLLG